MLEKVVTFIDTMFASWILAVPTLPVTVLDEKMLANVLTVRVVTLAPVKTLSEAMFA